MYEGDIKLGLLYIPSPYPHAPQLSPRHNQRGHPPEQPASDAAATAKSVSIVNFFITVSPEKFVRIEGATQLYNTRDDVQTKRRLFSPTAGNQNAT